MKCIIESLLEKHKSRLTAKSSKVIARLVKIKLHIDISTNAIEQKINYCLNATRSSTY